MPLPWIPPMKATVGTADDQPGWAAEIKWDGLRTSLATDGEQLVLRSSTGRDVTAQYPELADFGPKLGATAQLDGEIVVFEGDRPSFQRVLHRLNTSRPDGQVVADNPVVFIAFDLLTLDGHSLLELPYRNRRQILEDLTEEGPTWRVPPLVEDGADQLLELARARDLEGIVVKRLDSIYRPGARSTDWRKVKIRHRQEFVVGGWLAGQGSLEQEIGSLVLGVWQDDDLVMAGLAGSGLTDAVRHRLNDHFHQRDDPPFVAVPTLERRPTWVEPTVVVEVEFADWPADGMLRHPAFAGIRTDKDPRDVQREIPPPGSETATNP